MRRQTILYDPSKTFEFVLTDGVLRHLICPTDVMVGQLDRLLSLIGLPNIHLGIIPFDEPLAAVPLHGFALWDDIAVIETYDSELVLRADDAEIYIRIAQELMSTARCGDAARELVRRALHNLRPQ
jgi:hypothetical protein